MESIEEATRCACRSKRAALCQAAFVLAAHQTLEREKDPEVVTHSEEMTDKVLYTNLAIAECFLTEEEIAAKIVIVAGALLEYHAGPTEY